MGQTCSICDDEHDHKKPLVGIDPGFQSRGFFISLVPAPKCETCDQAMTYLKRGTAWSCQSETCEEFEQPVCTGIGGVTSGLP